ncbi:MAG: hypothetical protein GAK40_01294 [Burkholderia plantarii]|nr:MAG: hypothetical protein GAK40_01294 [Burkholderia plantarii]
MQPAVAIARRAGAPPMPRSTCCAMRCMRGSTRFALRRPAEEGIYFSRVAMTPRMLSFDLVIEQCQ